MDYRQIAVEQAKRAGVDPSLFTSLITAESNWNPKAVSRVGAQGFGQVMPETARQPGFGVTPLANPFDGQENLRFSADYLSKLMQRYNGDTRRALAAYNWGAGNADKWDGNLNNLPQETREYIHRIEGNLVQEPGALSGGRAPQDGDGIGAQPVMLASQGALAQNPNEITQFPVAGPEPVTVTSLATGQKPFTEVIADLERQGLRDDQAPIESIGISPEEAYLQDSTMPALAGGNVTADQVAADAIASSGGPSTESDPQYEPRGSFKDIFGLGNSEGGGAISRWLGWDTLTPDQRDDRWLAIGAGLLSGKDWAEGGSMAAQNVLGLRQQEKDNDYRMAALEARSLGGAGSYNRPFNVEGRDPTTGQTVVESAMMIGGVPHVIREDGPVPAYSVIDNVRVGGRGSSPDVEDGAGGIPNAVSVNNDGIPSFTFKRESEGQAYSWATRAIAAETDLTSMIDHYGPEAFTGVTSGLQQWASQNARAAVTPAVINSILDDSGVQGTARSAMSQFLQAILRSDTGAAYTGTEIADYAAAFLPNTGDDTETVAYKRLSRMDAIRGIIPRAGAASPYLGQILDGTRKLPGQRWSAPTAGALDSSNTGQPSEADTILKQYGL